MPEFTVRKRSTAPAPPRRPGLAMHAGQCTICRHPQRAEIERDFLDWRRPWDIVREYGLGSHTAVYRHEHALGLVERRHRTLQFALGQLIEQVGDVKPIAASIVSAIRLTAKLNTQQKWTEETESPETQDAPDVSQMEQRESGLIPARSPAIQTQRNWRGAKLRSFSLFLQEGLFL